MDFACSGRVDGGAAPQVDCRHTAVPRGVARPSSVAQSVNNDTRAFAEGSWEFNPWPPADEMFYKSAAMEIVPVLPAASILLVRDAPNGLEVLMVRRHTKSSVAAGALVFPGGKVDAVDLVLATEYRVHDDLLPYRIAAIRETWEEAGIFLARRNGSDAFLDAAEIQRLATVYRHPAMEMATIVEREAIELATDRLVRYAHWITPAAEPRRFDAQFFIAVAPAAQRASADGYEALECFWFTPDGALREADAGRALVVFPTRLNLLKLARSQTTDEALDRARSEPIVTVQPEMIVTEHERIIRISADSGYEPTEMRYHTIRPAP
jgi:8-oxo-dGTP pyrophosphatase MutT (NUDIX family)